MLPRALLFLALAVPVAAVFAAGCGDSATTPEMTPSETLIRASAPDASDALSAPTAKGRQDEVPAMAEPDAGAAALLVLRGNVLCHAPPTGCFPDDIINACDLALDGGAFGADANSEFAAGCHVAADGTNSVCLPGGGGMKNASCTGPSDCAAGHECVGAGFCHRYCCGGESECALNEFCDMQPMAQSPQRPVPVCMTMIPCTLLDNDVCQPSQQCGVVREDGSTSCIAIGTAIEGASCEDEHCGPKLVCLGAEGARHCAKLCYKGIFGQCKKEQNCLGALPLFLNPTVGVCQ